VIDVQSTEEIREEIKPAQDGEEAGWGSGYRGNVPGVQTFEAIRL
jgi:hypothetical protein